jgi:hypothetical protein
MTAIHFRADAQGEPILRQIYPPRAIFPIGIVLVILSTAATASAVSLDFGEGRDMDIFFMVQFWNTTTFDAKNDQGEDVQNRNDFFIRRGRVGVKGHFRPKIRYAFNFAFDGIGMDIFSGSTGTAQLPENKQFFLWDGFVTFALEPTWANLTVGYFRPQVGRESITSSFAVNSYIKAMPNAYPRLHFVGRGSGRETGLNLGGVYRGNSASFNYNLGVFDPNSERIIGHTGGGRYWSPMWSGRVAMTIGHAEHEVYELGYLVNYFSKRRGLTLAINATYQSRTNETVTDSTYVGGFDSNCLVGCDLLANYDHFNLSAEYDRMTRRFTDAFAAELQAVGELPAGATRYSDEVWFVRAGYNFVLNNGQVLEPALLWTTFTADDASVYFPGGEHKITSVGMNWYLDRNRLKLNLHYHFQSGRPVSLYSRGLDARGDFLGLGLQLVF